MDKSLAKSMNPRFSFSRWWPTLFILAALGACGWIGVSSALKIVDGPISEERIVAQEERLNQAAYDRFEQELNVRADVKAPAGAPSDPFQP